MVKVQTTRDLGQSVTDVRARWLWEDRTVVILDVAPRRDTVTNSRLSSSIIEDVTKACLDTRSGDKPVGLIYYYFNSAAPEASTRNGLLRAAAQQLLMQLGPLKSWSSVLLGWTQQRISTGEILDLLKYHFDSIYIVLDALNECGDIGKVGMWIERFFERRSVTRMRLLITSVDTIAVRECMGRIQAVRFEIPHGAVAKDIAIFLDEQIPADARCQKWPKSLQEEVRSRLLADARDGM